MTGTAHTPQGHTVPAAFTRDHLDWLPWLDPLPHDQLTPTHMAALVDPRRATNPYFRLLARDPAVLEARTKADNDIFYNTAAGLPRAERELAATAASRLNGCIYCASVHARFAATYSKREQDVDALLARGPEAGLDERWSAITEAATALTATPIALTPAHITRLRTAGLDELAIHDLLNGAAFFNWANRLMLSLGEPTPKP